MSRITAESEILNSTVPPGPAESKSPLAMAAPSCTDPIENSTRTVGGMPRDRLAGSRADDTSFCKAGWAFRVASVERRV
jgi:hypothetical protein